RERPCALERLHDGVRARVRVPVEVAADPGPEAERRPTRVGPRCSSAQLREQTRRRAPEALLDEPVPIADLVDDARALRAHLVRLPEDRDLLCQVAPDA